MHRSLLPNTLLATSSLSTNNTSSIPSGGTAIGGYRQFAAGRQNSIRNVDGYAAVIRGHAQTSVDRENSNEGDDEEQEEENEEKETEGDEELEEDEEEEDDESLQAGRMTPLSRLAARRPAICPGGGIVIGRHCRNLEGSSRGSTGSGILAAPVRPRFPECLGGETMSPYHLSFVQEAENMFASHGFEPPIPLRNTPVPIQAMQMLAVKAARVPEFTRFSGRAYSLGDRSSTPKFNPAKFIFVAKQACRRVGDMSSNACHTRDSQDLGIAAIANACRARECQDLLKKATARMQDIAFAGQTWKLAD